MTIFTPASPQWKERVHSSFALQSFMSTINARIKELTPGSCVLEAEYANGLGQQHEFFHAGVVSALGDTAAGYAAYTLFPDDADVLTAEFKISLLAPAKGRCIIARGEVVRSGRRLTTCLTRLEVVDDAGNAKLCAIMLATIASIVRS